jgi:hypothetical protein
MRVNKRGLVLYIVIRAQRRTTLALLLVVSYIHITYYIIEKLKVRRRCADMKTTKRNEVVLTEDILMIIVFKNNILHSFRLFEMVIGFALSLFAKSSQVQAYAVSKRCTNLWTFLIPETKYSQVLQLP